MKNVIEKIFNHWVLLFTNVTIIIVTELSGTFFVEKGIIHLIAIFFVILGISRIFAHYDAYDRYLRLLIHGGSAALIIFSISHLIEFLGFTYFKIYEDAIFVSVVNLYVLSMLVVSIGAEYFLYTLKKDGMIMIKFLSACIILVISASILIFFKKILVSLDPDEPTIYIYIILILIAIFLSVSRLVKIKKHVSIITGFANYFIAAFVLIAVSALQYIFYDILERVKVPDFQTVYISHFLFYGALSLMFLAFVRLAHLDGIYKEAEKYKN